MLRILTVIACLLSTSCGHGEQRLRLDALDIALERHGAMVQQLADRSRSQSIQLGSLARIHLGIERELEESRIAYEQARTAQMAAAETYRLGAQINRDAAKAYRDAQENFRSAQEEFRIVTLAWLVLADCPEQEDSMALFDALGETLDISRWKRVLEKTLGRQVVRRFMQMLSLKDVYGELKNALSLVDHCD